MIKYIIVAIIIYIVYLFLFKAKRGDVQQKEDKKRSSQTMVECKKCSVFVSNDEAYIKDGKYYCSHECMGS